ncbi:hypothetical protein T05_7440 [Trichinella murrelli]|uniref:Uncharacterized protein n=1 Tax=Trichinella murrelli TaxID=144512 RepID=A0A0V0U607_9BILA|nr:hypothetical protein T05_7440 [Trichinella murrelli]
MDEMFCKRRCIGAGKSGSFPFKGLPTCQNVSHHVYFNAFGIFCQTELIWFIGMASMTGLHFLRNTDRCSRFNDSDTLANGLHFAYFTATDFYSTNIKYYKHSVERFHIFLPLSLCTPQRSFLPNKIQLVKR